jgi:maltose operon protein
MPTASSSRPTVAFRIGFRIALLACVCLRAYAAAPAPTDPAEFRYEALPVSGVVDFAITRQSPTFEFQTGKSAYRAFALPATTVSYLLDVESFVDGGPDPRDSHVLYPVVTLMLEDYLVSRTTDIDSLRFELPILEQARAPAYRLTVLVDPSHSKERYLVIYTPEASKVGREPEAGPAVADDDEQEETPRHALLGASPLGRLRISVRPTAPAQ